MTRSATRIRTIHWLRSQESGNSALCVAYRGPLCGPDLRLHYGFDGWQEPIREVKLQQVEPGLAVTEPLNLTGHLLLDCVVTDGKQWDNNLDADYRLWIGFDPLDSHLHASGKGSGELGVASLQTALASAGISHGIVSWMNNAALDRIDLAKAGLFPLVWVRPGDTAASEVRTRLADGAVGLKLHPTLDDYRADDSELAPYMEAALEAGCPVACHSAPGEADPDHIRRLAERFPTVPVILYHTYLGPQEGRRRAAEHAREQSNLYLETSWCQSQTILQLVKEVGPDRVLFGSDASVDGPHHYCRRPPNIEGKETYNTGLLSLIRALGPESTRKVMGDNARRLFGLNGNSHD
ncbi:MAG: amidohydrolase family protein [Candidatus Binatia bacterium]